MRRVWESSKPATLRLSLARSFRWLSLALEPVIGQETVAVGVCVSASPSPDRACSGLSRFTDPPWMLGS